MKIKNKNKIGILTAAAITGLATYEIVVNTVDWVNIEDFDNKTISMHDDSSLYLSLPGSRCSGFVIAPELVMTNYHCIGRGVGSFTVTPDYKKSIPVSANRRKYKCDTVVHSNDKLDYSIAHCPGMELTPLSVNVDPVELDQNAFLLSQNCDYKQGLDLTVKQDGLTIRCDSTFDQEALKKCSRIAPFCKPYKIVSPGKIIEIRGVFVSHVMDSLAGSSGGAILNEYGELIALHNSGYSYGRGDGRGYKNGGILLRSIIANLPGNIRNQIKINGDLSQLQTSAGNVTSPSRPVITKPKKRSFKCKWFGWLFKKQCK